MDYGPSDRARLRAALDRLEASWPRLGLGIADSVLPGLDDDAIREAFAAADLEAPAELVVWFGWHNGALTDRYTREALPGWWLLRLDECIEWFLSTRDFGRGEGWPEVEWLFPFVAMDSYRLLAEVRPGSPTVPIHVGPRDDSPHGPYAESLVDFVEFAVELMEGPAVYLNEEHGILAVDRSHPAVQARPMLF